MNSERLEEMDLARRFPARRTDLRTLERLAAGARADWAAGEGRPVPRVLPWLGALSAAAVLAAALVYGLVLTRAKADLEPSAREAPGETVRSAAGENEKPPQAEEQDPPKPAPAPPRENEKPREGADELEPLPFEKDGLAQEPPDKASGEDAAVRDAWTEFSAVSYNKKRGTMPLSELRELGGSQETVNAVDRALRWLARHQEANGQWDCVKYGGKQADVGVTGLALLAFLANGHTEKEGKYSENVARAVDWLKSIQDENGCLFKMGETHSIGYHHGIAGLALIEAAEMARVPATVRAAQRAVDYSVDQHRNPGTGGWRYAPRSATSDICVSAWFIQQIVRAKEAGLKVKAEAFDGAAKFLDSVQANVEGVKHCYGYTDSNSISHRRTAMGIYARQLLGWQREDLQTGVNWFIEKGGLPDWGANGDKVDMYFWYYGSLAAYQQGGQAWKTWNAAMKKALVSNQRRGADEDGSWDPYGSYSGYVGRTGQTAMLALCLEVYYRYGSRIAKASPPRAPKEDEVALADKLIVRMGSEEFQEREDAMAELLQLGPPIHAHLVKRLKEIKAQARPDQEIVTRLTRAVQKLEP